MILLPTILNFLIHRDLRCAATKMNGKMPFEFLQRMKNVTRKRLSPLLWRFVWNWTYIFPWSRHSNPFPPPIYASYHVIFSYSETLNSSSIELWAIVTSFNRKEYYAGSWSTTQLRLISLPRSKHLPRKNGTKLCFTCVSARSTRDRSFVR